MEKMDLDQSLLETYGFEYSRYMDKFYLNCRTSFGRVIASEAWSEVLYSVASDKPPSDMSEEYYHSRPESGFDYLQKQLKHLEIYRYKLGTEYILARARSDMDSLLVKACEFGDDTGFPRKDSEISTKSNTYSEVVQEDKGDLQVMENIQCPVRSAVRSEVVQADKYQQGIENIQCPVRSAVRSDVVKSDNDQQGIENIQYPMRSAVPVRSEVVQAKEDEDQQGIENIQYPMRSAVPVRSEVVQAKEDEDQRGTKKIQSPVRTAVHMQAKYQQQIEHLITYGMHYKVVQANEGENEATTITLENIQEKGLSVLYELLELVKNEDLGRTQQSTPRSEVLELIKHLHDDGITRTRMELERVLFHLNLHKNYDNIEKDAQQYIKKYIELILNIFNTKSCQRTLCRKRGKVEGNRCWYWKVMHANKEISILFDELLKLVENGDNVHGEEKPNMRFKVLKLIKVLHHYGVDTIRIAVKVALESVKRKYVLIEKDSDIGYKKKALEAMLRICDIQTCRKTLYELISTTESDQVLYT